MAIDLLIKMYLKRIKNENNTSSDDYDFNIKIILMEIKLFPNNISLSHCVDVIEIIMIDPFTFIFVYNIYTFWNCFFFFKLSYI